MKLYGRNWRNTCLSILLAIVCFMTSSFFFMINAKAVTVIRTGTVVGISSHLNLRSDAGTGYSIVKKLNNGDTGKVIGEKKDSSGDVWYQMEISGATGYAHSKYIDVTTVVVGDDGDFEAYLTAQNFPDSYKQQLRILHAKYPNWIFQAQHTNLKWNDVIAAESSLGKNLTHAGAASSWKSIQNGAYDWEKSQWIEFDSGGWVAASKEIIQYFMDPRNFLDETAVFQFLRQSYNVAEYDAEGLAQVKAGLTSMVANTFLAGKCDNQTYVDVIMSVAAEKGVSPYVLASMMIQELGTKGDSASISGTVKGYEGYYNYYNIGAFKTEELSAIQKGLAYAKGSGSYGRPWNTRYKAIAGGAEYYASGYVKKGQDTMYLKKYNVQGSNLYGHQYMTNVQGAYSEGKLMARAYDSTARQGSLVFKIPVYKDMPATACVKPTGDGNPNYMLKSLEVSGYSLTPTFNMYETSYSLIVPSATSSITVAAGAYTDKTSIAGVGTHSLKVGSNTIQVTATAQNGAKRTYTITVVRQEPPAVVPTPSVTTSTYKINSNSTVTGITSAVNAGGLKSKFSVQNGTIKVVAPNGTEKADTGTVGTGDQVRIYDIAGVHKLTYHVVIYGDTNGDGKTTTADYVQTRKQILGTLTLGNYNKIAADTNRNGKVDLADYVQMRKQILGQFSIQQ